MPGSRFFSMPSSRLAWWSVGFAVTFLVLMALNLGWVMHLPEREGAWARVGVLAFGFTILGLAIAAFATGTIALVVKKERSWMIWALPILVGCYMTFMLLGELLVTH